MHGCSSTTNLISSQLSHSSSEICDAKKIDQYLTSDEAVKKVLGLGGVVGAVVGSFVGTSPYELMKGEDICHISGILQKDLDAEPVNKKRTWRNNDTKVTYEYTYIGKEQNDCVSYKLRAYEPKAMFIHNKRYKVCRVPIGAK